jgi:predicted MFS family arabinose efflux permease
VTLAPLYARKLLDVGPTGLGGMLSAVGLGAVVTALLLAWLGDFQMKERAIDAAAWAFALSLAGLAFSRRYALSLAFLALLGGAMMSSSSLINTLMQKRAPAVLRGRVISLYALAWSGFVPLGNLQAGAVAQRFGAASSLWVGAAGIAATLAFDCAAFRTAGREIRLTTAALSRRWACCIFVRHSERASLSPLFLLAAGAGSRALSTQGSYNGSVPVSPATSRRA